MLSAADVAGYAFDAGVRSQQDLGTAVAVALAESGADPKKLGDVGLQTATWGPSVGLWQIRSLKAEKGKGTTRDQDKLTDPAQNAKSMVEISKGGTDFGPWSVTHATQDPLGYARFIAAQPVAQGAAAATVAQRAGKAAVDTAGKAVDSVGQLAGVVSDAAQAPVRVITWLTEGGTWTRIGYFAAGFVLIVGAGLVIAQKPIMGTAGAAAKLILPTGKIAKAATAAS